MRFLGVPLLHSEVPGAAATVRFDGTAVGVYVLAGPDAGQLEFRIDEGEWQAAELYHRFSKGLHYPRTVVLACGLPATTHTLEFRVGTTQHADSRGGGGKHYHKMSAPWLLRFGMDGVLKILNERMYDLINHSITKVFVEQPRLNGV